MDVEPRRGVLGSRFTISIRTSIPWNNDVRIESPELEKGMVWGAYPYARSWKAESAEGETVRLVEVLGAVSVERPGFFTLGPFRIEAGGRRVLTEQTEIIGLERDEADLPFPVFTAWRSVPETIWQGQAVPVVLEARNLASLVLADSVSPAEAPQGLLEEAPGLGGIVTRPHGDEVLYDVPVASWIWTPGEPGSYSFPGIRCRIAALKRAVPGFSAEVLPVPEEALDSGAVGRFILSAELDEGPYRAGDILSLRVRVEGEGNMNVLRLPEPEVEGAVLAGRSASSSYLPGFKGFEGWREDRYDFQLERSGNMEIRIPRWVWFDPDNGGQLRWKKAQRISLTVEEAAPDAAGKNMLPLLGDAAFQYPALKFHWRNKYWLFLSLPGFIVLLVVFLVRYPGKKALVLSLAVLLFMGAVSVNTEWSSAAGNAARMAEAGNWDAAADIYEKLLNEAGPVPGLLHDMAFVRLNQGQPDQAVYLMRRAMSLRPGTALFKSSLELLEGRLSLGDQVAVPLGVSPSIVFAVLLFLINLFFLLLLRLMYRRDSRNVIIVISAFILLGGAVFFSVYTEKLWQKPTAVVRDSSQALRKIPGPLATNWIQLPAGTAVAVVAEEGNDVLLRTGFGLEGWLPESSLLFLPGDSDGL